MFTLVTDRSKYFRVKRGQSAAEIESTLNTPVTGCAFAGKIIPVSEKNLRRYVAQVGDTYRTIALKFGADENELKKANNFKPVYPTCKVFVPCK
ncbi:MAG: LysM peptidoglycan-binding domain-containing protein [Clostridia bacterium]|nr:LysM peptidoglycan-binding domain-containing protein [Clostridia bacterium]